MKIHNAYDSESSVKDRERGQRSEEVAQWYFRLNGVFLIPGFIVHPDVPQKHPRTEADLLGIRLQNSSEGIWRPNRNNTFRREANRITMKDDSILLDASMHGTVKKHLVCMIEVKAGECNINGPWSDNYGTNQNIEQSNMKRALGRVGFGNHTETTSAARDMYEHLRHVGNSFIVQYFAVGRTISNELRDKYPRLVQITFDQIGAFLQSRFTDFPEKIPADYGIDLWKGFGDKFRRWFESSGYRTTPSVVSCQQALIKYINTGQCG